jgi:tight adherence protein B
MTRFTEVTTLTVFVCGMAALIYGWRWAQLRRIIADRLYGGVVDQAVEPAPVAPRHTPFVRRHYLVPWLIGAGVAAGFYFGAHLHLMFAIMFGSIIGLLGGLVDAMRVARSSMLIESQLANSIDLIVGALHAGASLPAAIESALVEAREPLKQELEEVRGRLRLGDNPQAVFGGLMQRVPLESFRLLAATFATHWEVGGNLAPTLATVGRTIRDRIDVSRRIRSVTAQSRVSTIVVLAATYFIALVMWRNDPQRMNEFLATTIGRSLVTGAVVLQAIGIVWSANIGKIKY